MILSCYRLYISYLHNFNEGYDFKAHLISGVNEQTMVAHLAEMALCLGDYENEDHCKDSPSSGNDSSATLISANILCLVYCYLVY